MTSGRDNDWMYLYGGGFMFGIGLPELVVILLIGLLVFGADKLPGLGRAMGKTISEFKKGVKEAEDTEHDKIEKK